MQFFFSIRDIRVNLYKGRASTRTVGNLILLSSRAKIKGRRMLGMAVSTLFLQDQSALGFKALDI